MKQRTRVALAMVFLCAPLPALADEPKSRAEVDAAIAKGLLFLSRTQETDGSWRLDPERDAAATSLAVMAFLSAGHVPGEGGPYSDKVEKGIRWVLGQQQVNGLIATKHGNYAMYEHGISTLMLAEAAGMTDKKLAEAMRPKLENAVKLILDAQRTRGKQVAYMGGWRYGPASTDSDMSVTGWQLMALRSAKDLGCDVPPESIDLAVAYIKRSQNSDGGFRYQPGRGASIACTATGIVALELCGKDQHGSPEVQSAAKYLRDRRNRLEWNEPNFFYSVYYCSQATFQVGGNDWRAFRPHLHSLLLTHQATNGAWEVAPGRESRFSPNFGTAMAILALTVEYRFLPIYQRGEEPTDKPNR